MDAVSFPELLLVDGLQSRRSALNLPGVQVVDIWPLLLIDRWNTRATRMEWRENSLVIKQSWIT